MAEVDDGRRELARTHEVVALVREPRESRGRGLDVRAVPPADEQVVLEVVGPALHRVGPVVASNPASVSQAPTS